MTVEWIKLTIDMFNHQKIRYIRRLPEGNNIVLMWVMLLTMAGRCNSCGMIFLTENIPYTPKSLADELGFEENTVRLALKVLEELDMIVVKDEFFAIAGWEEYQSIDGLNKIREQNRIRQKKWYENHKKVEEIEEKEESKVPSDEWFMKAQEIWEKTFAEYPKRVAGDKARYEWEKIVCSNTDIEQRIEKSREIYKAIRLYVADYKENSPEDTSFKYVPRLDNWFRDHLDVWLEKLGDAN